MSKFKKIALIVFIGLVGIQFIPTKLNISNEISTNDFTVVLDAPINIKNILEKSCYDCHSNNTQYPWYNKIQPVAYLLQHHIEEGKEELNFSEFDTYSKRKKRNKLKAIINQIKDDEMPPNYYTIIHSDTKLDMKQKELISSWVNNLIKDKY